ncbi:MAG: hypothetical protein FWG93_08855, partial [Oscillospiraceae bacterium]|nr:hypothetical protein [Oscillospiraceae bacterium]
PAAASPPPAGGAPAEKEKDPPAVPEEPPAAAEEEPVISAGAAALSVRVFFEQDCKMENIRAYQIVNALSGLADHIDTLPADLLEDCSDEIIANGVLLTVYTSESLERIRAAVAESLFVKSIEARVLDGAPEEEEPSEEAAPVPGAAPESAEDAPAAAAPETVPDAPPAAA